MRDGRLSNIYHCTNPAQIWIAIEPGFGNIYRQTVEGRDSTIRATVVAEVFVFESDVCVFRWRNLQRRRDSVARDSRSAAECIGVSNTPLSRIATFLLN